MIRYLIADRVYLKKMWLLALPLILQYLISASVNLVDSFMIGSLGDVALASINIGNQFFLRLFHVLIFGVVSGGSILNAQFWGIQNRRGIHHVIGLQMTSGLCLGLIFSGLTAFFPEKIVALYSNDPAVIQAGAAFFRAQWSVYLFYPMMMIFTGAQRSTGNPRLPMFTSSVSLLLKLFLNYLLIFGNLGFPQLGILGSAYATLIARLIECLLLVWLTFQRKDPIATHPKEYFQFDMKLARKMLHQMIPVTLNEGLWGLGTNVYSAIYAKISTAAIAAVSAVNPIDSLMFTLFLGFGDASGVMIGHSLGRGDREQAFEYGKKTILLSGSMGVIVGIAIMALRGQILSFYQISPQAYDYAVVLLAMLCFSLSARAIAYTTIIGALRSGGDVRFSLMIDVGTLWLVGIPVSLLLAFVFQLPLPIVYLGYMLDEFLKSAIFLVRFSRRKWMNTLTA